MHPLIRRYAATRAMHLNGNILIASLCGACAATWVARGFDGGEAKYWLMSTINTLANAGAFVSAHVVLHALVRWVNDAASWRARFWPELRLIYWTALPSIAVFLGAFTSGQRVLLAFGFAASQAVWVAYLPAQLISRLLHTLLLQWLHPAAGHN